LRGRQQEEEEKEAEERSDDGVAREHGATDEGPRLGPPLYRLCLTNATEGKRSEGLVERALLTGRPQL